MGASVVIKATVTLSALAAAVGAGCVPSAVVGTGPTEMVSEPRPAPSVPDDGSVAAAAVELVPQRQLTTPPDAWDPEGRYVGHGESCHVWQVNGLYRGRADSSVCERWRAAADEQRSVRSTSQPVAGAGKSADTHEVHWISSPFRNVEAMVTSAGYVVTRKIPTKCEGHLGNASPQTLGVVSWSRDGTTCVAPTTDRTVMVASAHAPLPTTHEFEDARSWFSISALGEVIFAVETEETKGHVDSDDAGESHHAFLRSYGVEMSGHLHEAAIASDVRDATLSDDGAFVALATPLGVELRAMRDLSAPIWRQSKAQLPRFFFRDDSLVLVTQRANGVSFTTVSPRGEVSRPQQISGTLLRGQLPSRAAVAPLQQDSDVALVEVAGVRLRCRVEGVHANRADFSMDGSRMALMGETITVIDTEDCSRVVEIEHADTARVVFPPSGAKGAVLTVTRGGAVTEWSASAPTGPFAHARQVARVTHPSALSPDGAFICDGTKGHVLRTADGAKLFVDGSLIQTRDGVHQGSPPPGSTRKRPPVAFRIGAVVGGRPMIPIHLVSKASSSDLYEAFWKGAELPKLPPLKLAEVIGPDVHVKTDAANLPYRTGAVSVAVEGKRRMRAFYRDFSGQSLTLGETESGQHDFSIQEGRVRFGGRVRVCFEDTGACTEASVPHSPCDG